MVVADTDRCGGMTCGLMLTGGFILFDCQLVTLNLKKYLSFLFSRALTPALLTLHTLFLIESSSDFKR